MGRGVKPPPQFGQTFLRTVSTHAAQNVHSYEQMRASREFGGNARLQCSQVGLSSSIDDSCGRTVTTGLEEVAGIGSGFVGCGRCYSAVVGSMILRTSEIRFAGNPPSRACSRII